MRWFSNLSASWPAGLVWLFRAGLSFLSSTPSAECGSTPHQNPRRPSIAKLVSDPLSYLGQGIRGNRIRKKLFCFSVQHFLFQTQVIKFVYKSRIFLKERARKADAIGKDSSRGNEGLLVFRCCIAAFRRKEKRESSPPECPDEARWS